DDPRIPPRARLSPDPHRSRASAAHRWRLSPAARRPLAAPRAPLSQARPAPAPRPPMTAAPLRLRVLQTAELEPERFEELDRLCEAAFEREFRSIWDRVGPGIHVIGEAAGRIAAHAMIVDRRLYVGHE